MKTIFILVTATLVMCHSSFSIAQNDWIQITQLPSSITYSISIVNDTLYAGGLDKVYTGTENGNQWTGSAPFEPEPLGVDDVVSFNDKTYAATYGKGVFVRGRDGRNWQQFNAGLSSLYPREFAVWKNSLYVGTGDAGVYKLNSSGTQWQPFNNGLLPGVSMSVNCFVSTGKSLIAGIGANGLAAVFFDTSSAWEERYLTGGLAPGLQPYDLVYRDDKVWAIANYSVYLSTDKGNSWSITGTNFISGLFNKLAVHGDTVHAVYNKNGNMLLFKRNVNAPITEDWTADGILPGHGCYEIVATADRIFAATEQGLFYRHRSPSTGNSDTEYPLPNILLFPNPVESTLFVTTENMPSGNGGELRIYGADGSLLKKQTVAATGHSNLETDVSSLPAGVYFATVSMNGKVSSFQKFIKVEK